MDHARGSSHSRRLLKVVLVASLAAGGGIVVATTGASAAASDVSVLSISQYGPDRNNQFQLIGEVRNSSATAVIGPLSVNVTFLDDAENVLFQDNTFTNVDALSPGERTPFELTFPRLAGYTHYSYVVSDGGGAVPNHNFTITKNAPTFDGTNWHLTGTVHNNNGTTAEFVNVVGTAYDAANLAVDVDGDYVAGPNADMAPNATTPFELIFLSGRPFDHTALVAQSSSAPSAPVAASPSPSPAGSASPAASPASPASSPSPAAASPSPAGVPAAPPAGPTGTGGPAGVTPGKASSPAPSSSASPTASPTASPKASPTASPSASASPQPAPPSSLGCTDSGGPYVLRVAPSYAKISRNGAVTLSARLLQAGKTCQAGIPLVVYVRGPGTTLYHASRTLSTDSQGLIHAVYSRPKADFRWYVRRAGSVSGQGLVQVR